MTTLFISDLHLDETRPAVLRGFAAFLERECRRADALYILGDLTEVWVGDDDDSAFATELAGLLNRAASETEVLFMHGNRDFLIGSAFANRTGIRILEDPHVAGIEGEAVLLSHGDLLCTRDLAYLELRKTLRDPEWQRETLAKPLAARREMAAALREQSRAASANKADNIMDVTPAAAEAWLTEHEVSTLIHGHTHRPAIHEMRRGTRIVLGDWDRCGWALRLSGTKRRLERFALR